MSWASSGLRISTCIISTMPQQCYHVSTKQLLLSYWTRYNCFALVWQCICVYGLVVTLLRFILSATLVLLSWSLISISINVNVYTECCCTTALYLFDKVSNKLRPCIYAALSNFHPTMVYVKWHHVIALYCSFLTKHPEFHNEVKNI